MNAWTSGYFVLIPDVLEGYNGTIFAYGQTSSGKTHTMEVTHPHTRPLSHSDSLRSDYSYSPISHLPFSSKLSRTSLTESLPLVEISLMPGSGLTRVLTLSNQTPSFLPFMAPLGSEVGFEWGHRGEAEESSSLASASMPSPAPERLPSPVALLKVGDIMEPGVSVISHFLCFCDNTSGRVHLDMCWIDQSTCLPSGL